MTTAQPATPGNVEKIASVLQSERWAGQDAQREFDRRIVEYAQKNGIDPLHALTLVVHALGQSVVDELRKGLNL